MDDQTKIRVVALEQALQNHGMRMTPQRVLVLEALVAQPGHTTAERIIEAVQRQYPHVNKATVYRTLDLLSALGLVAIGQMGGNQAVYELLDTPHHHLICKSCGTVLELPDSTLNPLRRLIEAEHGFQP